LSAGVLLLNWLSVITQTGLTEPNPDSGSGTLYKQVPERGRQKRFRRRVSFGFRLMAFFVERFLLSHASKTYHLFT